MRRIRAFLLRLAGWYARQRWERDLAAEIESNVQLHIEDNLRSGMTPEAARRAALLKLGGIESAKQSYRDQRSFPLLDTLARDLRHAGRSLWKSPMFTAACVLSLALGIGANTAIFSLIDAILLRELPIKDAHRLFSLSQTGRKGPKEISNIPYGVFKQLQSERQILSGIFTFHGHPRANVVVDGQGEVTDALRVSNNYLQVLGVQPVLGRGFQAGEENVAVISHRYWQRRFAGKLSVLGSTITINTVPYTVIGVTPPEFFGVIVGTWIDVTIPIFPLAPGMRPLTDEATVAWVMGRLEDRVTEQQAAAVFTAYAQAWMESRAAPERPAIVLGPASRGLSFLRLRFSKPLHVLMAMVALVLLIACTNVAGLLVARASVRQQEMALRLGLGASRGGLVRQLLTESILLSFLGGFLGFVIASWAVTAAPAFLSTMKDPVGLDLAPDMRVFAFALLLSTVAGIAFGLAPALQGTRIDLVSTLRDASRSSGGSGRSRLRRALVVSQIALALLLVSSAALLTRSLANLKGLDTGFERGSVLLMSLEPGAIGYKGQQIAQLYEQILDRVEQVPGVGSASLLRHNLLADTTSIKSIALPGREPRLEDQLWIDKFKFESATRSFPVGPRFIETLGMTLIEGRDLTRADRYGAPHVALVNETFARHFFPGESALGKRFGYSRERSNEVEIVGVIRDVRHVKLREQPVRSIYVACLQDPDCWREITLQVRTSNDPAAITPALRRTISEVAPNLPVFNVTTLESMFDQAVVTERTLAALSGWFGSLALLLASIGLYGLLSYSLDRRRREIGIRVALGADPRNVVSMVLAETGLLIAAGIALGLPGALAAGRWIASFLYGLTPSDPLSLALTVLMLIAMAAFSAWLPARRAARMDPMISLRHE